MGARRARRWSQVIVFWLLMDFHNVINSSRGDAPGRDWLPPVPHEFKTWSEDSPEMPPQPEEVKAGFLWWNSPSMEFPYK